MAEQVLIHMFDDYLENFFVKWLFISFISVSIVLSVISLLIYGNSLHMLGKNPFRLPIL